MEHKTIHINPELFKLPETKKTRKQPSGANKIKVANPNQYPNKNKTINKKLLKYIREKQEENYKKKYDESLSENHIPSKRTIASLKTDIEEDENEINDFKNSLDFFKSITPSIDSKIETQEQIPLTISNISSAPVSNKINHNSTIKQHPIIEQSNENFFQPFFSSSDEKIKEEPPIPIFKLPNPIYGCLKNGNLPTYKMIMNKTRNNNSPACFSGESFNTPIANISVNPQITISNPENSSGPSQLSQKVQLKNTSHIQEIDKHNHDSLQKQSNYRQTISEMKKMQDHIFKNNNKVYNEYKIPRFLKKKKTYKRTFNLGKSKYHPRVSVLIPNKTIRTKINTESQLLKQVPIEDVKKYLIMNGFIKVGSIAPDDVLRKMYESAIMIGGEIKNHNSENLLYNYLNYENSIS